MKKLRFLRGFILASATASIFHVAWGVNNIYLSYFNKWPYWITAEIKYQGIWYETWRKQVLIGGIIGVVFSVIAVIACVGLWKLREWGRYLWLFISLIMGTFKVYAAFNNYFTFRSSELLKLDISNYMLYSLYFIISCFSWIYLTRPKTIALFHSGHLTTA